ncbi:Sgo0707 family adhesin [Streptococcus massiliensis]|uniref:Fibril-like structure subunit FibA n=1 Tax=Streptococcus massiliensis TaxID=313439 RepID=A0A380KYP8_9STRE|nr:Sgo0707 family adhesin [Streptococcus massiliensis]SUN75690.1 fibril-like structure subunit FibA [Streptococcus massiliensis]
MKRITKKFLQLFLTGLTFLFLFFSGTSAYAVTELTENRDLSKLQLYQFSLKQENMEVLSQGASVVKANIPPSGNWKASTAFSLVVNKASQAPQNFDTPLQLRFRNAGVVYGKPVDVYITVNRVTTTLIQKNSDYYNARKTAVPFLTVDENWGIKSIQVMDYIYPPHPSITYDMYGSYALDADVTAELRYQDGTPTDLKLVMLPSDIDVVKNIFGREETFSIYDNDTASNKIIKHPLQKLDKTVTGNKTTWHSKIGTSGAFNEANVSGFAVRSSTNTMKFEFTTAVSGGLFGFYVENPDVPQKTVSTTAISAQAGQAVDYTAVYKMPTPGKNVIGSLSSMKMIETLDSRLDFKNLTVQFNGRTLTNGSDYTVEIDGQKVTVTIAQQHLASSNAGKEFKIVYQTETNATVLDNRNPIDNQVTQEIDNLIVPSNTVTTNLLFKKTHSFISGTNGKELPPEVLQLLPPEQTNLANGTTVAPDPPIGNKTQVSVAEGNWIFQSYDKPSETIQDQDVHFVGTWIFQEYEKPTKEVLNNNGTNIDNQEVKSGDVLTYKITYKNTTDSNKQVTITDVIPNYTEYVRNSSSRSIVQNKRWLKWTATVPKDKTVTIQFKVKVDSKVDGQELNNTATVTFGSTALSTNTTKNKTPFKKYVLPETGGQGPIYYLFGGAVLTTISALWLIRRFKQTMTS